MADQVVAVPVSLRYNGVTSFIPPTFCFDLIDAAGETVATVSDVVIDVPSRGSAVHGLEAIEALREDGALAVGSISEYDAGATARQQGRRFTVLRLINTRSGAGTDIEEHGAQ
jgi:hypothetical protein